MAFLHIDSDKTAYLNLMNDILQNYPIVIIWQNVNGKRVVFPASFFSYDVKEKACLLQVESKPTIIERDPVYFYCEGKEILFKSHLLIAEGEHVVIQLPEQIYDINHHEQAAGGHGFTEKIKTLWNNYTVGFTEKISTRTLVTGSGFTEHINTLGLKARFKNSPPLDPTYSFEAGPMIKKQGFYDNMDRPPPQSFDNYEQAKQYGYSEDEFYSSKREAPRLKAGGSKNITVQREEDNFEGTYPLFDLSTGGMGFIVNQEHLYSRGQILRVMKIDKKDPPNLMRGEVMSIRGLDDGEEGFKVGVKFFQGE